MVVESVFEELIAEAIVARKYSYSPYSRFKVGAALLVEDKDCEAGYRIVRGSNVENASYPVGNCAEKTAVVKAVSEGYNKFYAIAVVGGKGDTIEEFVSPCGICRQVLREFANPKEFTIIMAKSEKEYRTMTLEELLPESFGPDDL